MNTRIRTAAVAVTAMSVVLAVSSARAGERAVPYRIIPASTYQSFIKNWDEKTNHVLLASIASLEQWDAVFHPAPLMGGSKPFAPDASLFAKERVLIVARVVPPSEGSTTQVFRVDKVSVTNGALTVRYTFREPTTKASCLIKEYLAVAVPTGTYRKVVFIENGAPVGELETAKAQFSIPEMNADPR
jgi:hypothetical protein